MSELANHLDSIRTRLIDPARFIGTSALRAGVHQSGDPIPYGAAIRAAYQPVETGRRWGPVWSNAWFRLSGQVPSEFAGKEVFLRFSSGTEAMLWRDGEPRHGFDTNHELAPLRQARAGEPITVFVEAACNRPLGATTFFWDDAAEVARWREDQPGVFERAELVTIDSNVDRLSHVARFVAGLLRIEASLPENEIREVIDGLSGGFSSDRARECAERLLSVCARRAGRVAARERESDGRAGAPTRCMAVGHAHIDTAWLWRIRETRRKLLRTWSTALELIDRNPEFRFAATSAQHYAWVEEDSPPLFARVRAAIASGRWEATGAMWIEPDANLPSGESLIRQIAHGRRYFRDRFGALAHDVNEQRVLFLPDTFGFPASLPQIAAKAGIDTFIFNKLSWNDTNEFPHSTFWWRGIDGTRLLSHCTPGLEYNATNTPPELRKGDTNHRRKCPAVGAWLQPFGYGDGGGGPTDWMIENVRLADRCEGMPLVNLGTVGEFRGVLHEDLDRAGRTSNGSGGRVTHTGARGLEAMHEQPAADGAPATCTIPTHAGELYLERHRGTYTTHARIKRANREAEELLRLSEILVSAAPVSMRSESFGQCLAELDEAWKVTLLNQFHDVLPGSSIAPVYEDSRRDHERVLELCHRIVARALEYWPRGVVMNPASTPRRAVARIGNDLRYFDELQPLAAARVSEGMNGAPDAVKVRSHELSNSRLHARIDPSGRVGIELIDASGKTPVAFDGLNWLVLYDDRPKHWEAWDIDESYIDSASPVETPVESYRVVERHPLRSAIELTRRVGERSRITQRFTLEAMSPRLDVRTRVEWHESRTLLRVLFPTDMKAREATYGIQFGHISRPSHTEDSAARAMFEVCAHRWMDLSDSAPARPRGLSILNDGIYGCSCRDGVLGLSLLRSTKFPDESADMGEHEFTYSIMPHEGEWRGAGVDSEAEALNRPPVLLDVCGVAEGSSADTVIEESDSTRTHGPSAGSRIVQSWWPCTMTCTNPSARVEVSAVCPCEDGFVLRLVETRGVGASVRVKWHKPVREVTPVDLLERPCENTTFSHNFMSSESRFDARPFEIVSIRCRVREGG